MRILVLDTETAGLDPKDGVCEIAIIEVDENLNPVETFSSLIDPEGPISPQASGVHGIVGEDVKDAPTLEEFFEIILQDRYKHEDVIAVGHNVKFDLGFVGHCFKGEITPLCTLRLARHLYPDAPDHKLQTLRYAFGLESKGETDNHRALGDTLRCLNLLMRMSEDTGYSVPQLIELSVTPIKVQTMPFGKHKGLQLSELPYQYKKWLLDKAEIDDDLRCSLQSA